MSVCLSTHIITCVQISSYFLRMLPLAVARSSSDSVVICYVLTVLWMMSYFQKMESGASYVFLSGDSLTAKTTASISTT